LTGAGGGHDLTLSTLAREGVVLLGRLLGIRDGKAIFAPDLAASLAWGEGQARWYVDTIDNHIREHGLDAPAEGFPDCLVPLDASTYATPEQLNLADTGISTVVWATSFRPDLDWVRLPVLDTEGYPIQRRGVTDEPGLYVLGLDWLYKRSSGLFGGVSDDAAYLASVMVTDHAARSMPV
jgi:putative flavoprotein involved in K+ transport